jgi:molybdenum cofactor biosynthesis enzyme MoaA
LLVDHLFEVRLIGGEPFVHPEIYELIDHCSNLQTVSYVFIFTNSTLRLDRHKLRSGCINFKKVSFQVTNYGGKYEKNLYS